MNVELIGKKLETLGRCISRLEQRKGTMDPELQDVIALDLEQGLQICLDMASTIILSDHSAPSPTSMPERFDILTMKKVLSPELAEGMKRSIELRNIFLNSCRSADRGTVVSMLASSIRSFREFAESVSRHTGGIGASSPCQG